MRKQLKCFKVSSPKTVKSVAAIFDKLSTVYRESSPFQQVAEQPTARWCTFQRTSDHDTFECRASATASTKETQQRWCDHHKYLDRDTKDFKTKETAAKYAESIKPSSSDTRAAHLPRYFRCNQAGHFANRCPSFPPTSSSASNHHVSFDDLPPASSSATGQGASVDDALDALNSIHSSLHIVHTESDSGNSPIMTPIRLLPSTDLEAYIDTGTSHSIIRRSLLNILPLYARETFKPAKEGSMVSLGAKGPSPRESST